MSFALESRKPADAGATGRSFSPASNVRDHAGLAFKLFSFGAAVGALDRGLGRLAQAPRRSKVRDSRFGIVVFKPHFMLKSPTRSKLIKIEPEQAEKRCAILTFSRIKA